MGDGRASELMYLMGSHKLKLKTEALIVYGREEEVGVDGRPFRSARRNLRGRRIFSSLIGSER